jgi:hypothetical protein
MAGNAYNSLVDLPDDGTGSITNGRDGKVDATDDNSAMNAPQRVSTTAASPELQLLDDGAQLVHITNLYTMIATSMRDYVQIDWLIVSLMLATLMVMACVQSLNT